MGYSAGSPIRLRRELRAVSTERGFQSQPTASLAAFTTLLSSFKACFLSAAIILQNDYSVKERPDLAAQQMARPGSAFLQDQTDSGERLILIQ